MDVHNSYQQVTITGIKEEIPGVKIFILTPQGDTPIPYSAGQFLTFAFQHHGREERRSFSITSTPGTGEPLAITVKRLDNGAYSRLLIDKAAIGDVLYTTGAAGLFTLPADINNYEQVFFFAAGIGITPVLPLIKAVLYDNTDIKVALVYSNSTPAGTVFITELQELRAQFSGRLQIEFLYSNSFNLGRARLSKWLLPTLLAEYGIAQKDKILFYTCGPFSYMRMVILALEEQGIPNSHIKRENFDPNGQVVIKQLPPDTETHTAFITLNKQPHAVRVQYPDTILQAAKKQGILLPYSCETGRCGSCAATCTTGNVWLSYNEVLMDADLAAGRILTCTGHPVNGDVTIVI